MESKNNVIIFNAITDKSKVDYIIFKIREAAQKFVPNGNETGDGFPDLVMRRFPRLARGLPRIAVEASILLPGALIWKLFDALFSWLKEQTFEAIFHVPFIVLEVLVYLLLITAFYGRKRVRRWVFKIPKEYKTYIPIFLKGALGQSADVIINSKNFISWERANAI